MPFTSFDTLTDQVRTLKAIDRLIGPWLVRGYRAATAAHPPSPDTVPAHDPAAIRNLVVIRPGGIGDAVLVYPMLAALKEHYAQATLTVIAEQRNASIFRTNDLVDQVWRYDRELHRLLPWLRRTRPEILIDTEQSHYLSALVGAWSGSPVRIGFDTNSRRDAFTHVVPYNFETYEVRSFLQFYALLTGQEREFDTERPFLPVRTEAVAWAKDTLGSGERVLCISPGASIPRKRWPWQNFYQLAQWAVGEGFRVLLIGGADCEREGELIADADHAIVNLVGRTSLPQSAALIQQSDVFVSADTGVLHIAYGVGTPTVHLFGPGVLSKWAPPGRNYIALTKNLPCSPCMTFSYARPCTVDHKCMKLISVEETIDAVKTLTNLPRRQGRLATQGRQRPDHP